MLKTRSGKIISKNIRVCDTFWQKGTGLMFRSKNSVKDTAWLFTFSKPSRIGITMWFVFFPIDIIFLDKNNKVVELVRDLKPFSFYNPKVNICSFIEFKAGLIKDSGIIIGTKLRMK